MSSDFRTKIISLLDSVWKYVLSRARDESKIKLFLNYMFTARFVFALLAVVALSDAHCSRNFKNNLLIWSLECSKYYRELTFAQFQWRFPQTNIQEKNITRNTMFVLFKCSSWRQEIILFNYVVPLFRWTYLWKCGLWMRSQPFVVCVLRQHYYTSTHIVCNLSEEADRAPLFVFYSIFCLLFRVIIIIRLGSVMWYSVWSDLFTYSSQHCQIRCE